MHAVSDVFRLRCMVAAGDSDAAGTPQGRGLATAAAPEAERAAVGPGRGSNAKARNAAYATCPKPVREPAFACILTIDNASRVAEASRPRQRVEE